MDFTTIIDLTPADRVAAAAVVMLDSIDHGTPVEFVVQSILRAADGDVGALKEARELHWVQSLDASLDFQFYARVYTDGKLMPAGSKRRVLDLLSKAQSRLLPG